MQAQIFGRLPTSGELAPSGAGSLAYDNVYDNPQPTGAGTAPVYGQNLSATTLVVLAIVAYVAYRMWR